MKYLRRILVIGSILVLIAMTLGYIPGAWEFYGFLIPLLIVPIALLAAILVLSLLNTCYPIE
jgi:hypothetical protein